MTTNSFNKEDIEYIENWIRAGNRTRVFNEDNKTMRKARDLLEIFYDHTDEKLKCCIQPILTTVRMSIREI